MEESHLQVSSPTVRRWQIPAGLICASPDQRLLVLSVKVIFLPELLKSPEVLRH